MEEKEDTPLDIVRMNVVIKVNLNVNLSGNIKSDRKKE